MTTGNAIDRRAFVRLAGTTAIGTALAGCTGDDESESGVDPNGDDGSTDSSDDGSGDSSDDGNGTFLPDEPDYDGWFDDVEGYDGTHDMRDTETVTIAVGGDGGLSFGPAAVGVSPGTTVVWEWTGDGGGHDVVASDETFASEVAEAAGHTFEHSFDDSGVFTYACTPHKALGMKGAIVVE